MQSELSILPQLAREKAAESDLPAEAESALQQQIEQRVHPGRPLRVIFKPDAAQDAKKRQITSQMTKEIRMTRSRRELTAISNLSVIRVSSLIRHSSFDIRH